MKKENWDKFHELDNETESRLADAVVALNDMGSQALSMYALGCLDKAKSAVIDANKSRETAYGLVSDSYYDECEVPEGYDDLFEILPDGKKLSVGEMRALITKVEEWKKEYGY